jgi:hypothetical protein
LIEEAASFSYEKDGHPFMDGTLLVVDEKPDMTGRTNIAGGSSFPSFFIVSNDRSCPYTAIMRDS